MATPLRESDLLFSHAARSFHETLGEIKRADLSLQSRLRSIQHDADFVQQTAKAWQLPLIANERCGSWYIPPTQKVESAYFKSTDGHFGQWSFSLRRLNVHLFKVIGDYGGCIIVDSTRRGKSIPDALSKTVPIWIAVFNRLLFPDRGETHVAQTPLDVVSRSEHSQIQDRLDELVDAAKRLQLDVEAFRSHLHGRPMRPQWVTPAGMIASQDTSIDCERYHDVILCTASSRDSLTDEMPGYVQGAADDHETWAMGLTPVTFWNNHAQLMSASTEELPMLIQSCVGNEKHQSISRMPTKILPTENVFIGGIQAVKHFSYQTGVVISCGTEPLPLLCVAYKDRYLHLQCAHGKVGSRQLRHELSKMEALRGRITSSSEVLVVDDGDDNDLAVGVALALICLFFTAEGRVAEYAENKPVVNKAVIKQRLSWIMTAMPRAAPSRATLQSVNAYLMA